VLLEFLACFGLLLVQQVVVMSPASWILTMYGQVKIQIMTSYKYNTSPLSYWYKSLPNPEKPKKKQVIKMVYRARLQERKHTHTLQHPAQNLPRNTSNLSLNPRPNRILPLPHRPCDHDPANLCIRLQKRLSNAGSAQTGGIN
jgi:hypothetical protein